MLTRGIALPTSSGLTAGLFNTPVEVGDIVIVEHSDHLVSAAQVIGPLPNNTHPDAVEITIMLKPCKVVTRSTALVLFFKALAGSKPAQTKTHAWHDALRARGVHVDRRHFYKIDNCTAEQASLFVRTVGVDRIVEALVHSARQRKRLRRVDHSDGLPTAWCDDHMKPGHTVIVSGPMRDQDEALYGVPYEVIPLASNGHVLADKLLSLNHWVAESHALWISRPKGTSRAKWQRAAALKFVQALPVPADMYAMRHEPGVMRLSAGVHNVSVTAPQPTASFIQRVVLRELPKGTRDPLLLARVVEDAMQELYRCSYLFTLHALSDTRWGVTIGRGYNEASFDVPAPLPASLTIPTAGPYPLPRNGSNLVIVIDGGAQQLVTFESGHFVDMRSATQAEVAVTINAQIVGAHARRVRDTVEIASDTIGGSVQITCVTSKPSSKV